ncbi:hypothetical protein EGR_06945 [Echinococcus granulosus]|uniref:Uncharacterized protein n=1 Tax=Echinococcus granulosus TaxID=6210 RepID=W6UC60_ECHGR|nr:hypothetical protein EGR_06945 [Echinococcus granulosus]EUB58201.1 hypothetical protein EGR_06945 [Echinococcus granulosus]
MSTSFRTTPRPSTVGSTTSTLQPFGWVEWLKLHLFGVRRKHPKGPSLSADGWCLSSTDFVTRRECGQSFGFSLSICTRSSVAIQSHASTPFRNHAI